MTIKRRSSHIESVSHSLGSRSADNAQSIADYVSDQTIVTRARKNDI